MDPQPDRNPTSATKPGLARAGLFQLLYLLALILTVWLVVRFGLDGNLTQSLAKVITRTGAEWVMYVLVALSIFSVGVFFERFFFYRKRAVDLPAVRRELHRLLKDDAIGAALELVRQTPGMEGRVATACLQALDEGDQAMEEAMLASLAQQRLRYDRNLSILGTLGNNAPFIGLLGTVLGIIRAFLDLSRDVAGGAAVVMAGISEALVATAIGLLVAIPSVIAFNWLNGRVIQVMSNTETLARTIMEHAKQRDTRAGRG